jgi:hypothetical protein
MGGRRGNGKGRERERGTLDGKREGEDMKGTYREGQWDKRRMVKNREGHLGRRGNRKETGRDTWEEGRTGIKTGRNTMGRRWNGKGRARGTSGKRENRKGRDR